MSLSTLVHMEDGKFAAGPLFIYSKTPSMFTQTPQNLPYTSVFVALDF